MATFTETLTASTLNSRNTQFIPYDRTFVAGTPFLQPNGKPVQWFSLVCGDELDVSGITTETISVVNGFVRFSIEAVSGLDTTLDVKVGDYIYWYPDTDALPQYLQITEVIANSATELTVVTDLPTFTDLTLDETQPVYISYTGRLNRLRPFVVTDGTREYQPNYTSIFVNEDAPVTGLPEQAILIDLEQVAISWFPEARPFYADAERNRAVGLVINYALLSQFYQSTDGVGIVNALDYSITIGGIQWCSNLLNSKVYRNRWQLPDCRIVDATPYLLDSLVTNYDLEPYNSLSVGYTQPSLSKTNLVGPRPMWLAWQSRYGGYDVWCFNYDQTDTTQTNSYGTYRQGYANYDLGKQATRTLNLNSGLVSNEYKDWFVDLQNSNKVWFTDDVFIAQSGAVNFIDHDKTDWQECTIDDMNLITSAQNTSLIEFMCTVTFVELLKSYRS